MELILKPTGRCNFSCSFCSSTTQGFLDVTEEEVISVAKKCNAQGIIVNGGDPLMMSPDYYKRIHDVLKIPIALVSNLKDFWYHPKKWKDLFLTPGISVNTSFQFGNGRLWDPKTVYTEKMFRDVMSLFNQEIGYSPSFISVIDFDNEHLWKEHVLLAKELGTTCRLNNALKVGKQGHWYPRYKMFEIWIKICEESLDSYEQNCFERKESKCPMNTNFICRSTIRAMQKEKDGKLHYYPCGELADKETGEISYEELNDTPHSVKHKPMNISCYSCELFSLCNGCYVNQEQVDNFSTYCKEMKKIIPDLRKWSWI